MLYWYWHPLFFIQFTKLRKKLFGLKITFQLANGCKDI